MFRHVVHNTFANVEPRTYQLQVGGSKNASKTFLGQFPTVKKLQECLKLIMLEFRRDTESIGADLHRSDASMVLEASDEAACKFRI